MIIARNATTAVVLAAALAGAALPAQAEPVGNGRQIVNALTRLGTQYGLAVARTFVDLTYEHLAVDPRTGDVVITGLKLNPLLDWDKEGTCEIDFGRITRSDEFGFETIDSRFEISGVRVAPSCIEPGPGAMLSSLGYDGLTVDNLSIDLSYDFASSGADITLYAAVKDAAAITVTGVFDYVWVTLGGFDPEAMKQEPQPAVLLSEAEISIENRGLYERLEPMLTSQMGDMAAVPQMVQGLLMQAFSEGGSRTPGKAEVDFANNVTAELTRFIAEKNRIVLSAAPPDGAWLDEHVFESPTAVIAALEPKVSSAPLISRSLVSTAELQAAISGQTGSLDEQAALRIGGALLTGIGAPRSVVHGEALLTPLAEQWNPQAALLLADAMDASGDDPAAYRMALRAGAGGEPGALAAADRIEDKLTADAILGAQAEVSAAWPDAAARTTADQALLQNADIGAIRERAQNAALGRDGPRNYADAYYWASLAAAAGDRSSAGLRERLDRRFAGAEQAGRDAWHQVVQQAEAEAIRTWTEGGLGARVAAQFGVAQ